MAMLEVKDLNVHYGVIHALKGISMEVREGEIVALIGANGAGKTTLLHAISGIQKKSGGDILFEGESLNKAGARKIVSLGITQVPEGRRIFSGMSVYENLMMGAFLRRDKEGIKADLKNIYSRFPILEKRSTQDASTLSGGEQQMLAMGRDPAGRAECPYGAVCRRPRLCHGDREHRAERDRRRARAEPGDPESVFGRLIACL